jgi:hypothetical protein
MGKQETSPQPEPQESHSIDFQIFGYDREDPLARLMQDRLKDRGSQTVVHVATVAFGPEAAALSAKAISSQGDDRIVEEFRHGIYKPKDENVVRLLIGLDIAQRLADTQHSHDTILGLFGKKSDEGTVYERLHTTEDKDLATLHRRLQHRVHLINQKPQTPDKPTKRVQKQTIYGKQKRRG